MQTREEIMGYFLKNTAEHTLKILRDDGLYRHLRMDKGGSSIYHYEIITYPGYLTVVGDMGSYTFQRLDDMFVFFRDHDNALFINPGYWSEKLVAVCKNGGHRQYEPEVFLETVRYDIEHHWCIDDVVEREAIIKHALEDAKHASEFEYTAHRFGRNYEAPNGDKFQDFWEHDLKDYTYHYIWLLYGIVHAIRCYDEEKACVNQS